MFPFHANMARTFSQWSAKHRDCPECASAKQKREGQLKPKYSNPSTIPNFDATNCDCALLSLHANNDDMQGRFMTPSIILGAGG
jgi:NADH pyrophosphatase NudC (nudix superfamily)